MKLALLTSVALVASCSDHGRTEVKRDPERQRRVIEPPSGRIRPLPPHAIRADGVGPYRLRASLADLLEQLPSGPRIETLDIPRVVHRSILRAEDDAILIGGEPLGKASFIAVIGGEVARTESGIQVGSTRAELVRALGAPVSEPGTARDPRLVQPSGLPNARIVLDADRILALVVTADVDAPRPVPAARDAGVGDASQCVRPIPEPEAKRIGACLMAGELVSFEGDEIAVRSAETDKLIALTRVTGLVFAAPLKNPSDGRDELVAIARTDDREQRSWVLVVYRLEGARLVRADPTPAPLYQLTAASARWIGAELRDLDLYLELNSRPDTIEVGGLLTKRIADKIHDVVVISPVSIARRRAKSAPFEAADAGTPDAAPEPDAEMNADRPHH